MAHFGAEMRPARDTETLFEAVWGLYRDRETSRTGSASLLQGVVLTQAPDAYLAGSQSLCSDR